MEELIPYAGTILDAVLSGDWWVAAAALATVCTLGLRLAPWEPLKTVPLQVLGGFGFALLGGLLNALAAGSSITGDVLVTALQIGIAAGGSAGGLTALWAWWKERP